MTGWLKVRRQTMLPREPGRVGISLIVALRNEEVNVERLATVLAAIEYPHDRFEIILINDHSVDSTASLLRTRTRDIPSVRVLDLPDGQEGKKKALLYAIQQSRFEIIMTTDADCHFSKNLLLCAASYYADPNNKLVVGAVKLVKDFKPGEGYSFFSRLQIVEFMSLVGTSAAAIGLGHPVMCNGANLSFRKETFFEVGGYGGNLEIASGDDEFLMRKINRLYPGSIRFLNYYEAVVSSTTQKTFADFFNQRLRWAGKWRYNSDRNAQLLAVFILVAQSAYLAALAMTVFSKVTPSPFLLLKTFLECIFLLWVARFLNRRFDVLSFVVLQIFYPPYVFAVGVLSFFTPYHWKSRNYKQ